MDIKCPHCQIVREVPDEWVGKKAKCPACQTSFKIIPYFPPQKVSIEGMVAGVKQYFTAHKSPPRTLLITVWEIFGWVWFTFPMIVSLYIIATHRAMAIPYLLVFAPLAFLPSIVAFTAAEVIRLLLVQSRR